MDLETKGAAVPEHEEPILSVKDLAVSFDTYHGEVQAVRGVNWYLNKGETIAIVGESGCGKTVSIQTVLGTNPKGSGRVKSGEIRFKGESLLDKTPKEMRTYQGGPLVHHLSGSLHLSQSHHDRG